MTSHLPSLRGLAALDALERHGGQAAAAEALGVTRSALSHRISELESELGCRLTTKNGRRSVLTEEAVTLLSAMGDALGRIEAAVAPFRNGRRQIRLSTIETFATRWLVPRLGDFRRACPEVDLVLLTTLRAVDFKTEDLDCAIRHGAGVWSGLTSHLLFRSTLVPVGVDGQFGRDPERWPAIHARNRFMDWGVWWGRTDQLSPAPETGLIVENRGQALDAAIAGAGVALTDIRYAESHLALGRLAILGPTVQLDEGYYFVHPPVGRNRRYLDVMREWLAAQVRSGVPLKLP